MVSDWARGREEYRSYQGQNWPVLGPHRALTAQLCLLWPVLQTSSASREAANPKTPMNLGCSLFFVDVTHIVPGGSFY